MSNQSEVARLRQRIADECQASWWALHGLSSGTAQHEFIHARFQHMEKCHGSLRELVGEEQATNVLCEVWDEQALASTSKPKEQQR
jgi:hypothetical protein